MGTFDTSTYLANKAASLNNSGYQGRKNWTVSDVSKAFLDNGMTPEQHYERYGKAEGISPYAEEKAPVYQQTYTPVSSQQVVDSSAKWGGLIGSIEMPTNQARTITENETVSGQLNKLLASDSPYIQSARATGLETANKRGLINSGAAAASSQKAAIDAAAPIAGQDASTYAASGLSAQNANQDLNATRYNALTTSAVKSQETENALMANDQQGLINSNLQAQKAYNDTQLQTSLKQMGIDVDLQNIAASDRSQFSSAASSIMEQYQAAYSNIMMQPDSSFDAGSKAAAVADLKSMLNSQLSSIASVYNYKVNWS